MILLFTWYFIIKMIFPNGTVVDTNIDDNHTVDHARAIIFDEDAWVNILTIMIIFLMVL